MSEPNDENITKKSAKRDEESSSLNHPIDRSERKLEDSLSDIDEMLSNQDKLKDGFRILSNYETQTNFYLNFLKISFDSNLNKNIGYVQGINYLAAHIINIFEDELVFADCFL